MELTLVRHSTRQPWRLTQRALRKNMHAFPPLCDRLAQLLYHVQFNSCNLREAPSLPPVSMPFRHILLLSRSNNLLSYQYLGSAASE